MLFLIGIRTKAKAIAQQERMHEMLASDRARDCSNQEMVHTVLHSGDPIGRQLLRALWSLRSEHEMHI